MADGYKHRPTGVEGLARELKDLRRQVENVRAAHKMFSAVIGAGGITITDGGHLRITDGANWFLNAAPFDFTVYSLDADGNLAGPFAGMNPGDINVVAGDLATGGGMNTDEVNGCLGIYSLTGKVKIQHQTTGSAANAVLDAATGIIYRSTSSKRYKRDVMNLPRVDVAAVLKLQPKTWRDRREVEENPDTERRYVGLIAEDLDKLGLGAFVEYDEQGRPDAIPYPLMFLPLLEVAKAEHARVDELTKQVAKLASRLDKIEGTS